VVREEIAPGIHLVISEDAPGTGINNTYLVVGSTGAVWVDTGWDREGEAALRTDYWRKVGSPPIEGFVITHRHPPQWGNAAAMQKVSGGPILSTQVEKDVLDVRMGGAKIDRAVEDGETLSLGDLTIEFVHAPGHTYGCLAVLIREHRALFPGDTVMGAGTSVVNPGEGEIALFLQTMEKFLALNLAVIYPGQGSAVTDPANKLDDLIRRRLRREQEIVDLLRDGPKSLGDLYSALYPVMEAERSRLALNQVRSHLIKLKNEGRVDVDGEIHRLV
jgi:glyoxylase-like metal-dependent hydrolase (beta-lactamase superfamily II)